MTKTRDRILETAEVLFATKGYEGTSLRDITDRAGVNVAAVNYHFGSKEGLLREVLDRVVVPINQRRLQLLEREYETGTIDLETVLRAFLIPDLDALRLLRERDRDLPRFVARMYSEDTPLMSEFITEQFTELGKRFGRAFREVLPQLDEVELSYRLTCLVGIVVYMFAGVSAPAMTPLVGDDPDLDLQRLLAIARSIMTAPTGQGGEV
jgi:AcrR family transcriptional regulator